MNITILWAFIAAIGTWALTALGAAIVLFFKTPKQIYLNIMLGFSSGVMIAASFWSLLQPAIEIAENNYKMPSYIIVTIGFILGVLFIYLSDKIISVILIKSKQIKNNNLKRTNRVILLISSITLHNIPEGLAVGVAFGILNDGLNSSSLMGAISIAIGIGLQNFPEGAAVSLPLRREGYSRVKSFYYGQLSAVVEPISAVIGASLVTTMTKLLPFALSFAAGTMILVAVHELIPECQLNRDNKPYLSSMGIILGFTLMMLLDVMLG